MATVVNLSSSVNTQSNVPGETKKIILHGLQGKKTMHEPLTIEKLRKRPSLENLSDEEATKIINTIKSLAAIFFEIASRNQEACIDNQQVVHLTNTSKAA